MARYLIGPDDIRVEPVQLTYGSAHLILARMVDPDVVVDAIWYLISRRGVAVGAGYYPDIEAVAEVVNLADLHGPDEAAGSRTA